MPVENTEIAAMFDHTADLLEIDSDNPFRVRAYRRANALGQTLARLDIIVAAVHSLFNLPREAQTERGLRAMDHPLASIIAHPIDRRIGTRAPYDIDMEAASVLPAS